MSSKKLEPFPFDVGHQFFSLSNEKPFDIQKIRNLKSEYLSDKIKKEDFIDRVLKLI